MSEPSATREPARLLASLAVQFERDRHAFVRNNAVYAVANLVLAVWVWGRSGGGPDVWIPAAIALLANVFYALTVDWELRWEKVWRRELPRLEREAGSEPFLSKIAAARGPRRIARGLKWLNWVLTAGWLAVLLIAIHRSGLEWGLGR